MSNRRDKQDSGGERFAQNLEHGVMDMAVACHQLLPIDGQFISPEVRESPAGFSDDDGAGGHVPGIESDFPEPVETSGRHVTQI